MRENEYNEMIDGLADVANTLAKLNRCMIELHRQVVTLRSTVTFDAMPMLPFEDVQKDARSANLNNLCTSDTAPGVSH